MAMATLAAIPGKTSLLADRGSPLAVTNTSGGTILDHEGVVRACKPGEIRIQGMRRVANSIPTDVSTWSGNNQTTVTPGVTAPDGTATAYTITANAAGAGRYHPNGHASGASSLHHVWVRRRTGSGSVDLYNGGPAGAVTPLIGVITTQWQRVSGGVQTSDGTRNLGFYLGASGDQIDVWHAQAEDVTSQAVQTPAEYVSVGVLSAPYQGAGVDGVQYFSTRLDGRPIYEPYGPELVTDAGWAVNNNPGSQISVANGEVTMTANGTTNWPGGLITLPAIVGRTYRVIYQYKRGTTPADLGLATSGFTANINAPYPSTTSYQTTALDLVANATSLVFNAFINGNPATAGTGLVKLSVRELKPLDGLGIEQITNGGPFTSTTGWSVFTSTNITTDGAGNLVFTNNNTNGAGQYAVTTVPNTAYRFTVTNNSASAAMQVYDLSTGAYLFQVNAGQTASGTSTAISTSGGVRIFVIGASGTVGLIGTVSMRPATQGAGELVEPPRSNLVINSTDPNQPAWGDTGGTSSAGTTVSLFTSRIVASAGAVWHRRHGAFTLAATTTYAISVYFRYGSSGNAYFALYCDGTHLADAYFLGASLQSATYTGVTGVTGWKVTKLPNSIDTYVATAVVTTVVAGTYTVGCGPNSATIGQTVEFLGTQVETGNWPSTIIPTAGTAVTRAADAATAPVAASVTQGTWTVSLTPSGAVGGTLYPGVALRGATAASNALGIYFTPSMNAANLNIRSNSVAQWDQQIIANPVAGVKYTIVVSWTNGTVKCWVNGVLAWSQSGLTMPLLLTTLAAAYDNEWFGNITNQRVFSTALPDATCLNLSATL